MRYYEWKLYRESKVIPILARGCYHELHVEAGMVVREIDLYFRLLMYAQHKKDHVQPIKITRRELDIKLLKYEIQSKISYLKELMIMIKLGT